MGAPRRRRDSASPARTGACPSTAGSPGSAFPCTPRASICRVIRQINGGADFCEEFFDDVVIPDDERIGDVDQGWTVTRTMLVFERGGSAAAPPKTPPDPGPLAPDLVEIAEASGRADDPEARQLVARGHSLDFLRRVLDRRLAKAMSRSGGDAGHRRLREAHPRHLRLRACPDRHGARAGRGHRVGRAGGHGRVGRAHVPQRADQLDRRRLRPDAAQRHQRAGARSAARAELGPRQAVRPGAARRGRIGMATSEHRHHGGETT